MVVVVVFVVVVVVVVVGTGVVDFITEGKQNEEIMAHIVRN